VPSLWAGYLRRSAVFPKNNPSMKLSRHPKTSRKPPAVGLVLQLFAIILLPLTILLVVITFGSLSVHQHLMRNMVGERDAAAVKAAASALSAQIDTRLKEIASLSELFKADSTRPVTDTLNEISYLMPDFDAGVAVIAPSGDLLAVRGDQSAWNSRLNDSGWNHTFSQLVAQPAELVVYQDPQSNQPLGLLSAQIAGTGTVVGAFSIPQLAQTTLEASFPSEEGLSILLVGSDHQILYQSGSLSDQTSQHPGVAEALQGDSGTLYVKVAGDEHVTAYSPVADAGWALITEESWEAVSTSTLQSSQIAPLVLVPAIFIMLVALWFGASQVIRPLRLLEARTSSLAQGDYQAIRQPVGGISEIQQLQTELVQMAEKVNQAQRSLHGYIGAITEAQEDERTRLARELHDDTLQALIALKQRVHLASLEQESSSASSVDSSPQLQEIAALTEQTIDNLRRLTRAMRPAYLDDLGLVPALEMLARETGQSSTLQIEFHHQGIERRLSASNELALYRMAQEALNNITRHAQAKAGSLTISFMPQAVILMVKDDGVGFNVPANPAAYAGRGHYGLVGLHERAELMGADLEITSAPGKGTLVKVTLPLPGIKNE
jgi:signal transduction histidine kinase